MTYSITNVRRDNDKIFANVNGCVYVVRKSGGKKYGSISLHAGPRDGVIAFGLRCHKPGSTVTSWPGWNVVQVVSID
jgi:hypothetical protein